MAAGLLQDAALLAICLLACIAAGKAAQRAQLPQITGFLVAGIAAGPHGLALIRSTTIERLEPLEAACLAAIALAAGAELHLTELQRTRRQVSCITVAIAVSSWIVVSAAVLALAPGIAFLSVLPPHELWAVASLAGTLAISRSPASAIAVLRETEGQGPYCSLVMAVVVVKDVLVFVTFATNLEVANAVVQHSGGSWKALAGPAVSLAMSATLGVAGGAVAGLALQAHLPGSLRPRVPASAILRLRATMLLATAAAVCYAAVRLDAEPLLACVTAGLIVANRRSEGGSRDVGEELKAGLAALMPAVNPVFFGLVGASVRLRSLVGGLWAAALLAALRCGAIWAGSWAGARIGRVEDDLQNRLWQGMITQAGIAMGLAKAVAARFPSWGYDFSTLMIGSIIINMLTGPLLFRAAIVAHGESRRRSFHDSDQRTLTRGRTRSAVSSGDLALTVLPESIAPARTSPRTDFKAPSPRRLVQSASSSSTSGLATGQIPDGSEA